MGRTKRRPRSQCGRSCARRVRPRASTACSRARSVFATGSGSTSSSGTRSGGLTRATYVRIRVQFSAEHELTAESGGISIVLLIITFFSLFLAFEDQISDAMRPATEWMRETPGGWLIPVGILFVLSFPPLFGHDIIAVLCGDVWGIWIGFAIVAAGTFLGEIANYYAFQYCCRARGKALEHKRLKYGLYAAVVREGGVGVNTVMRYTFIPGHFITAVFSTCGMSVWIYLISAFLSLPKQLTIVYIGVSKESTDSKTNTLATGLKIGVLSVNILLTFVAMWYINKRMDEVKHQVVYERRKARYAWFFVPRTHPALTSLLAFVGKWPRSPHSTPTCARLSSSTCACLPPGPTRTHSRWARSVRPRSQPPSRMARRKRMRT
ncbi:hypothetical protein C8Q80DRAFT_1100867 [Daedaleopsis nitida]|nr:hypothetical protein C8Q80DRAFT_1100867 [Daedaleopsis nitida]